MVIKPQYIVHPDRDKSGLRVMDMDGRWAPEEVQQDFAVDPSFRFISETLPFVELSPHQLAFPCHYVGVRVQHPVSVAGMLVSQREKRTKEGRDNILAFGEIARPRAALYQCNKIMQPGDLLLGRLPSDKDDRIEEWYGLAFEDLRQSPWELWRRSLAGTSSFGCDVCDHKAGFWEQHDITRCWWGGPSKDLHRQDISWLANNGLIERPHTRPDLTDRELDDVRP